MGSEKRKIAIVGGFGYLGSVIVDILSKDGNKVDVIDCCLFRNEEVKGYISYSSFENVNIVNTENNFLDGYDVILITSDIDVEEAYSFEGIKDYLESYKNRIEKISKEFKSKVYYVSSINNLMTLDDKFVNGYYIKYSRNLSKVISENGGTIFYVGEMYGPSPRMRWDTIVNNIFFNFVSSNFVLLDSDWLQLKPICPVCGTARRIADSISRGSMATENIRNDEIIYSEIANGLEIAHRIASQLRVLDPKQEFHVLTNQYRYRSFTIDIDCEPLKDFKTIEDSTVHLFKGLEEMQLPDFENDKYNNEQTVNNIINSYNAFRAING